MAVDSHNQHYLLGECKYKTSPFDLANYKKLEEKWPGTQAPGCYFYLFSQNGFTKPVYELEKRGNVACVTLEELVNDFLKQHPSHS